jgi:predicted RND superfamily exporter protein
LNEHEKPQIDFMHKLARQIVERRNLVFLFVILAAIFTVFSVRWVKVETDMTTYLPKTSETRMGLDIMDEQFTTYGSADVMVANITPAEADELSDRLTELKGVQMLDYDDTTDHYNKDAVSALYSITFDYPEDDDQCLEALDRNTSPTTTSTSPPRWATPSRRPLMPRYGSSWCTLPSSSSSSCS